MCDGGVATWKRSSWPRPSAVTQWAVPRSIDPCVCRTALGRSVVPELKTRAASSVSCTAAEGGAALLVRSSTAARRRVVEIEHGVSTEALGQQPGAGTVGHAVAGRGQADRAVDLERLPGRS